jgi:hypothetical protein
MYRITKKTSTRIPAKIGFFRDEKTPELLDAGAVTAAMGALFFENKAFILTLFNEKVLLLGRECRNLRI